MKRNQKAWLLTWEWIGDHAAVEDRIAGILRPRLSRDVVGEIVETIYAVHEGYVGELAYWSRRPQEKPYKAEWYQNHCFCGGNPSLHANYVHHLKVEEDPVYGLETIRWVMPPLYRMNISTLERELIRGEVLESVTRTIAGPLSDREIGRTDSDRLTSPRCAKERSNPMIRSILAFAILVLFPATCFAQTEVVVIKGMPIIQNKSSVEESVNFQLSESQQAESRLIITRKGQKYYWTSRQDRELTKHESGTYTIFLETKGAGYVKAMKSVDKVLYMEHMGLGLETITYWGVANYLSQ